MLAGTTGLAWWDAAKYEWKRSAAGNLYLAAQQSYLDDVVDRATTYVNRIRDRLSEDDFAEFDEKVTRIQEELQAEDAYDTAGIESQALRRYYRDRLAVALMVCGTNACSAEHRTINELSRPNGDVEKMQSDPEGYYASDVEKRESWGQKAVRLYHIVSHIADGDVIPTSSLALDEFLVKRIVSMVGDNAFEQGKKLTRPKQTQDAGVQKPTREELLALTA